MLCPLCAIKTNPLDEQGIMAAQCPRCQGIWIGKMALERLTRREAEGADGVLTAHAPPLEELAAKVTASNTQVALHCPYCAVEMVRERFHRMIPVEIDRCPKCDYIWMDAGEQELLLRLYRELMSNDDPALADQRAKLARLDVMRADATADAINAVDNQVDRSASEVDSAVNTGLNILGDLGRRDAGVAVACDVGAFLVNLLMH